MKKTLFTLISVFCVGSLFAEFQKVDDFEDLTEDMEVSTPWTLFKEMGNFQVQATATVVADPFNLGQGKVLALDPGVPLPTTTDSLNHTIERAVPEEQQIWVTNPKATFYFKVGRPLVAGNPGEADLTWGMAASGERATADGPLGYGQYSVLGRIEIDGRIDIRGATADGTNYFNLMTEDDGIETQTYYEIWFVVDYLTNTFEQYVKGGTNYPEQTKMTWAGFDPQTRAEGMVDKGLFRAEPDTPLDTILFISTAGNPSDGIKGKDPMYIDDLYIDPTGENLTSPSGPTGLVVLDFEDDTVGAQPNVSGATFSPSSNDANNGAVVIDSTSDPANPLEGKSLYIYDGGSDGPTHFRFPIDGGNNLPNVHLSFDFQRAYSADDTDTRVHVALGRAGDRLNNSDFRPFEVRVLNNGNVVLNSLDGTSTIGPYNTDAANTIDVLANSHDTDTVDYNLAGLGMGTLMPNSLHLFLNGEKMGEFDFHVTPDPANAPEIMFNMENNDLGQFALYQDTSRAGGIVFDNIVINPLKFVAPPAPTAGKLVNISTRGLVGTGDEVMIGGFILQGGGQQVLIQARGPELANPPFSLSNALADPVLTLLDSTGAVLMTNDDWEDSQGDLVNELWGGTAPLTPGGTSSAIVISLESDANTSYTAKVEGKGGTTGVALVEVYEID